jgi:hypothetical protein
MLTQVSPLERRAAAALLAVLQGAEWDAAILLAALPPAELARVHAAALTTAALAVPLDPESKPRTG